jgi:hypothetical protein
VPLERDVDEARCSGALGQRPARAGERRFRGMGLLGQPPLEGVQRAAFVGSHVGSSGRWMGRHGEETTGRLVS